MLQNLINHVSLVIDASGSMQGQPVVDVVDKQLAHLRTRSDEMNQETRVSIYLFGSKVECLVFDMDVMRFKTIDGHYIPDGYTRLIDATLQSIQDHQHLPQLYGDHAFLQYVITDGGENHSRNSSFTLKEATRQLQENWTIACLVPSQSSVDTTLKYGFNVDSIAVWSPDGAQAFEKEGQRFTRVMDNYMQMRASGIKSTKGLFTMDSQTVKKSKLKEVKANAFQIFTVRREQPIKEFVEIWTQKPYRLGSAYYEPTKPVVVQHNKGVYVQDRKNGRVYGGTDLRQLLGLPDATVKVNPGQHKDWRILVQSTSVNRKLMPDTMLMVLN